MYRPNVTLNVTLAGWRHAQCYAKNGRYCGRRCLWFTLRWSLQCYYCSQRGVAVAETLLTAGSRQRRVTIRARGLSLRQCYDCNSARVGHRGQLRLCPVLIVLFVKRQGPSCHVRVRVIVVVLLLVGSLGLDIIMPLRIFIRTVYCPMIINTKRLARERVCQGRFYLRIVHQRRAKA